MSLLCLKNISCFSKNIKQLCNLSQSCSFHFCCVHSKKKFVNPYIKQYNPKINNDYIEDHLMKTHAEAIFNLDESAPNFEQSLLQKARHKHNMYKRFKKSKELSGRKRLELPPLSFEQIQHIKHLNNENPDLWNPSFLAMSFNLELDQVKAVLKNKKKESELITDETSKVLSTQNEMLPAIASANLLLSSDSDFNENFAPFQESKSKESNWFLSFNESNRKENSLIEIDSIDEIEDDLKDQIYEDEHYEMFESVDDEDYASKHFNNEEFTDEESDDLPDNNLNMSLANDNETITVQSSDNCNFFDNEGRFLYKIYKS